MKRWPLAVLAVVAGLAVTVQVDPTPFDSPFPSPLASHLYLPVVVGNRPTTGGHGAGMTVGDCEAVAALGLEWTHGWQRNPTICEGVEAVPQISHLSEIGQPLGGNSQYVIYLNEPEQTNQSNVPDPLDAAAGLVEMLVTYPDKIIVLPSASLHYLTVMWDAGDFPPERVAANGHCYGWGYLSTALVKCKAHGDNLLAWADERGIRETWITEFGLDPAWYDGMAGNVEFMRQMVAYYERVGIDRWAWFQVNSTARKWSTGEMGLWVDGYITELGEAYRQ